MLFLINLLLMTDEWSYDEDWYILLRQQIRSRFKKEGNILSLDIFDNTTSIVKKKNKWYQADDSFFSA